MSLAILTLILHYSLIYNVPPTLAVAVAQEESGMKVDCVGVTGDLGLFQLNPKTFKRYTRKQLFDPETNIRLGIEYLAMVREQSVHTKGFDWIIDYNLGPKRGSKIKYPRLFPYYKKVMNRMKINEELKDGDKVIVSGLYNLVTDGVAIYRRPSYEKKDYHVVETQEGHLLPVHPDRVRKCVQ